MIDSVGLKWITPVICVTHRCNLNCIYCYESRKNTRRLDLEVGKKIINEIVKTCPEDVGGIEFSLIGGEPLLEFDLIIELIKYTDSLNINKKYVFSATTNGTVLNDEIKTWCKNHSDKLILCLSLDGDKKCHDYNRSNSYDMIDFDFFLQTYPEQGVKMTLSEFSLHNLYENTVAIHNLGFKHIRGANLFEGSYNWNKEELLFIVAEQLELLVDFYSDESNKGLTNSLFEKKLELLEVEETRSIKRCGIGQRSVKFYDVDGKVYPCVMCTPLTLNKDQLNGLKNVDFLNHSLFIDKECSKKCYFYPLCPTCPGANYGRTGDFCKRDRSRCDIEKIQIIYAAELISRKILNSTLKVDDEELYLTISSIQKLKKIFDLEYRSKLQSTKGTKR